MSSPDPEYEQKRATLEVYSDVPRQAKLICTTKICLFGSAARRDAVLEQADCQRKIETPHQNKKQYGADLIHWVSGQFYRTISDYKDNA